MPQPGWGDCSYGDCNFANCATPNADELDTDGHCHGSDDDSTYGWWVRDHWHRGYAGTLHCCCGWGEPMHGVVNRCDYRKPVNGDEVSTCRDANEEHSVDFNPTCDAHPLKPEPVTNGGMCWTVRSFAAKDDDEGGGGGGGGGGDDDDEEDGEEEEEPECSTFEDREECEDADYCKWKKKKQQCKDGKQDDEDDDQEEPECSTFEDKEECEDASYCKWKKKKCKDK